MDSQSYYSVDPRVMQDYSAAQRSCKTHIVIIEQTQGSCNIVQTQGSCNFNLIRTCKGYNVNCSSVYIIRVV